MHTDLIFNGGEIVAAEEKHYFVLKELDSDIKRAIFSPIISTQIIPSNPVYL